MSGGLAEQLARLSARERRLLAVLAFLVLPLGLAWGVVLPMTERREAARQALDEAVALRGWLTARQAELAALPPETGPSTFAGDVVGISGIEASLVDAGLRGDVSLLSNAPGGGVTLRFDAVSFLALMPWLEETEARSGYLVAGLRLAQGDAPDEVLAEVQLEPRP